MTKISLIAASLLLSASATAKALEVGEIFQLNPDVRPLTSSCDTLQELRSGNTQKCGTIPTGTSYQVAQKSDDAVCVKSPYSNNGTCYWAVIAPNALLPVKPPSTTPANTVEDPQKVLNGLTGFVAYLEVCDQWHKVKPTTADNVERMLNRLPFTMEQRRASLMNHMQKVKEIGDGKFCSEMAPGFANVLSTLERIDWNLH